jgi:hypothetical protein
VQTRRVEAEGNTKYGDARSREIMCLLRKLSSARMNCRSYTGSDRLEKPSVVLLLMMVLLLVLVLLVVERLTSLKR